MVEGLSELVPQPASESEVDETRRRILRAAAQVFGEQGYSRATTRALAAAAGVNEVTLFRHFGNKQNLFAAVIDEYAASALTSAIEAQLTGDYGHDLLTMGRQVMHALLERREAVRLMLCEAAHFPEVRDVMARNPRQLRRTLARYLERQMERGQVRSLHAEAAAQAFWGMFFAYAISLGLLAEPVSPDISPDDLVASFVDVFVNGTLHRDRA
jgi:AcrR family transcriptional regulator